MASEIEAAERYGRFMAMQMGATEHADYCMGPMCTDRDALAQWAVARLAADQAERDERARPIDAEWCEGECDEVVRYDGRGWTWMLDERAEEDVRLFVWDDFSAGIWWRHPEDAKGDWQPLPMTWNVETRGQLLDLLHVLKGGAE